MVTGGVIWDLVSWSLKGEVVIQVLDWYQWKNTSHIGHTNFKEVCNIEMIHGWFCCLFCKQIHILDLNDRCESFSVNWKFGSKSNLQRCNKSAEILSVCLSSEWSTVFCKSPHSSAGKIFLWLIKDFSFATEHTEGTCWWWPKSCHFGCPCGQLAQEDHKGNETQLLTNHCCARSWRLFIYNLTKCCIWYFGSC